MSPKHTQQDASKSSSLPILVGLGISLIATTLFWIPEIAGSLFPDDLVWRNVAAQGIDWLFALLLIAIVLFWEKESLTSLGFKKLRTENFAAGMGLGSFFMIGLVAWKLVEKSVFPEAMTGTEGLSREFYPPYFFLWYTPFALLTASICEEIIYRGYAMERLMKITNKKWLIILLPHIAFSLMHLKDGWSSVLSIGIIGLLFPLYYYKYRDLTMLIVAHFLIDLLAIVGTLSGINI